MGNATYIASTYVIFCRGLNLRSGGDRKRMFFTLEHSPGIVFQLRPEIRKEILFINPVIFAISGKNIPDYKKTIIQCKDNSRNVMPFYCSGKSHEHNRFSLPVYCILIPVTISIMIKTAFKRCHNLTQTGYKYIVALLFYFLNNLKNTCPHMTRTTSPKMIRLKIFRYSFLFAPITYD